MTSVGHRCSTSSIAARVSAGLDNFLAPYLRAGPGGAGGTGGRERRGTAGSSVRFRFAVSGRHRSRERWYGSSDGSPRRLRRLRWMCDRAGAAAKLGALSGRVDRPVVVLAALEKVIPLTGAAQGTSSGIG